MAWIRTAVNNNLRRTVWNVADSVVQHAGSAVAGGAKMLQDRIAARKMQNFRITVKRLEEESVSCRGDERVQLLRRWLVALKEIDRLFNDQNNIKDIIDDDKNNSNNNDTNSSSNINDSDKTVDDQFCFEEIKDSPNKPTLVYYFDPEIGVPMNFREVFLYSQALEGMTLSMILEAPNEEEVSLFMEIFRICLAGGKEVHEAVMISIKNLAMAFSNYQEEVLVKREELLQHAQAAIAGIKLNADLARIDAEACSLKGKLGDMKALQNPSSQGHEQSSEKQTAAVTEALKEALALVRLYSRLEVLLLKKKSLSNGDSPQLHAEKVDKLKVLSESLINSTSKAEKRIAEQRFQKEEALNFRVAKANEVSQHEKELAAGIRELEKQKDELEAELKKVNASLVTARARLHNAREEREHFDDASNQILLHLKSREEEISKSIASYRVEAGVVNAWINFLEDTWFLQTTYNEQKEKQVNGELERYGEYFMNMVIHLLSTYKEQLGPSISRFRHVLENLGSSERSGETTDKDESHKGLNQRNFFEEEYLRLESKFLTTFNVVDSMKTHVYSPNQGIQRKNDERVKELFDDFERIKEEFESIERPKLKVETARQKSVSPSSAKSQKSPWSRIKSSSSKAEEKKLKFELENDEEVSSEFETEEIVEWEYDAFEKDPKPSN